MATYDLSREGLLSVSVEADDAVRLVARGEIDIATADLVDRGLQNAEARSEEHTSELQSHA